MDGSPGGRTSLVRRRVGLGGLAVLVWLLAAARPAWGFVALGALLALAAGALFAQVIPSDPADAVPRAGLRRGLRRAAAAALFLPVFAWIVLRAGINIARLVLSPTLDFWPGIVRIKGGLPHRSATTAFAMLITLTPGTLTLDYDEERDDLYVHWIDVARLDGEATDLDRRVTSGMRPWVRRLFA